MFHIAIIDDESIFREQIKEILQKYMDERGKFHLEYSKPIAYSHGTYFSLGEELGRFGYSVRKNK